MPLGGKNIRKRGRKKEERVKIPGKSKRVDY
jgi:hypothetical protein